MMAKNPPNLCTAGPLSVSLSKQFPLRDFTLSSLCTPKTAHNTAYLAIWRHGCLLLSSPFVRQWIYCAAGSGFAGTTETAQEAFAGPRLTSLCSCPKN
jgi:hypothetical protein